jgi:hypothetical protein
MKQLLFTVSLLFCLSHVKGQTLINEYSCSNISTILDAFNEYEDWVELYNSGATAQNLTGYYLSDDPANLMKWANSCNNSLECRCPPNGILQWSWSCQWNTTTSRF